MTTAPRRSAGGGRTGRPRTSDNVALFTRLTEQDIAILARTTKRRRARSLSSVLERAVVELIEATDLRRDGLRIPACIGEPVPRTYQVSSQTRQLLQKTKTELGYRPQHLVRAAITTLDRERP